jgi:hypothetical protein
MSRACTNLGMGDVSTHRTNWQLHLSKGLEEIQRWGALLKDKDRNLARLYLSQIEDALEAGERKRTKLLKAKADTKDLTDDG